MMSKTVTEDQVDLVFDDYLDGQTVTTEEAMIFVAARKARGGQRQGNPDFALEFAEVSRWTSRLLLSFNTNNLAEKISAITGLEDGFV